MKLHFVVLLALCASYVRAALPLQYELGDTVTGHIDVQEFRLKAGTKDVSRDDQLLSSQLVARESVQGRNVIADAIKNLLESFRPIIINGNDVLPPLGPLDVPHLGPFTHSTIGTRITADVHNFHLEGLQWYVVDEVTFSSLRLALGIHMTLPWLQATGAYDASARIALLSHNAGGNFRVFVNRIEVGVDIRLGTNIFGGGHLFLRELDINIVIHDVTVRIEGMIGSNVLNSLINSAVQNAAQNLIHNELETISQTLSEQLFEVIDEFLRNFTMDDLLG